MACFLIILPKGMSISGLTDKNILEAGFTSGELTYYVVFGKNIDEIIGQLFFHHGPPALTFPLGIWQFCIALSGIAAKNR